MGGGVLELAFGPLQAGGKLRMLNVVFFGGAIPDSPKEPVEPPGLKVWCPRSGLGIPMTVDGYVNGAV